MSRYIGRTALSEVYGPSQDAVLAAPVSRTSFRGD